MGYLIALVATALIIYVSLRKRKKMHIHDIANLATTAGITSTFVGIVYALFNLGHLESVASIQDKISQLLSGMSIAFIPSIFGSLISLSTQLWPDYWHKPVEEYTENETDTDAQILYQLKNLNKNLTGNSEISLSDRLEKFQLVVTKNQEVLIKEFHDFSKNVASNIIEALKQSMESLNEKLGESFGENFKKFSDIVPKLLEWQENYKNTIEKTQQQLKNQSDYLNELLTSLESVNKSFVEISNSAGDITEHSTLISDSMKIIKISLTQAAEGISTIRFDAEQFQKSSISLTENITQQTEMTEKQTVSLKASSLSLVNIAEKTEILNNTAQQLNKHIETMSSVLGAVSRLSDSLQGKAEGIEKNMENITERTLSTLANNLRGISEALVSDYAKLQKTIHQITNQSSDNNI